MQSIVVHASMSGHTETLANAIAQGAHVAGAQVAMLSADQCGPDHLASADAIFWGTSSYFGGPNPKMVHLFERLGGVWMAGGLQGKVGGVFATTSTMHGGLETVLHTLIDAMMHHGMIIVPNTGAFTPERIRFGCPYGAAAVVETAFDMEMAMGQPTPGEMQLAYEYGQCVVSVASRLRSAQPPYMAR
ncbi:NAD(P)H-dependent oxidoreductase [Ferroacidibacillus organovorans]|uniref:Flavodoxin-like domain-containing protein n=1 Tax=Ferroacidibacillus organovorans TaxID=1765683 RepID=A0A161QEG0_9BACL|nr:NAD(P)H-dependent oxidoreductase [Ferroacidibacillus organovorans]KYP80150.1 hypothetical protein AYJ22_02620 [Ferroacidibacillus organovorans]OAG95026.1 hypothetical protein AYW79_02080 [Ferroacidibacillus organovorans]OPG17654.1 hypothetical protein B2M26_00420 [Ferroacidibacillus organovorans]